MLISTIIATICRDSLDRSVESVLSQPLDIEQFEIIVVNDSGKEPIRRSWQDTPNVKIINTNRRERSVARNAGAMVANGKYLHFLDDDDWLLPDGFLTFARLAEESTAEVLVGGTVMVDRQGKFFRNFYPDFSSNAIIYTMSGEWIPIGAFLSKTSTFREVGGFNQQMSANEDLDLVRRLAYKGSFYGNPKPVVHISVGQSGSTTRLDDHAKERLESREIILDQDSVWDQIHQSVARTPHHRGYWYGKLARIFFTSAIWNLQRGRIADSASRLTSGTASFFSAGIHLFSREYWFGLLRPHISFAYRNGPRHAPDTVEENLP